MKTFQQYVFEHDLEVSVPPKNTSADDILIKIATLAAQDHHAELLKFFESLAKTDHRIRQELDTYNQQAGNKEHRPRNPQPEWDRIIPNAADNMGGVEDQSQ